MDLVRSWLARLPYEDVRGRSLSQQEDLRRIMWRCPKVWEFPRRQVSILSQSQMTLMIGGSPMLGNPHVVNMVNRMPEPITWGWFIRPQCIASAGHHVTFIDVICCNSSKASRCVTDTMFCWIVGSDGFRFGWQKVENMFFSPDFVKSILGGWQAVSFEHPPHIQKFTQLAEGLLKARLPVYHRCRTCETLRQV